MMHKLFLILCLFCQFISAAQEEKQFEISFLQNETVVPVENRTLKMNRTSFVIQVEFFTGNSLYLGVLTIPEYFNIQPNQEFDFAKNIKYKVYAEYPNNREAQIFIDMTKPYGFHLLSLKSEESNIGFDEIIYSDDKRIGFRSVDSLFVMQDFDNRKSVQFANFNHDLYLTFVSYDYKEEQGIEKQRAQYRIVWKEKTEE